MKYSAGGPLGFGIASMVSVGFAHVHSLSVALRSGVFLSVLQLRR